MGFLFGTPKPQPLPAPPAEPDFSQVASDTRRRVLMGYLSTIQTSPLGNTNPNKRSGKQLLGLGD